MRLLDRYLLASFVLPFLYCVVGFYAIWLIYDLGTNLGDFISVQVPLPAILRFYAGQIPALAVTILPLGLLLSLLYCLTRLSQGNEIISMLNAGVSMGRILLPFFGVGLLGSLLSGVLNYQVAPQADARRDQELAEIEAGNGKLKRRAYQEGYLFANRAQHRIWFIERMPADLTRPLLGVQIIQQDDQARIQAKYYATQASFDPARGAWHLTEGTRLVRYDRAGDVVSSSAPPAYEIDGWKETPWRIASSTLKADVLSVPELREYLRLNADFTDVLLAPYRTYLQYRWALPWGCLVVVFISAPLGIVYSRRSVLVGVASSIIIFLGILALTNLCLALGRGDRIPAPWAAWAPNLFFTLVGVVLLRMRALNLDRVPLTPGEWVEFLRPR